MRRRSSLEAYLILFTTTEQTLADRTCAVLEDAQIPVMLEHVELIDSGGRTSGFRVLVPSGMSQAAMKLVADRPARESDSSTDLAADLAAASAVTQTPYWQRT
jgi:hypothetical protein